MSTSETSGNRSDPVVIVGTGLAGYTTAREWRKLDGETPLVMISRDDGSFYSKPALSNALAQRKTPEQLEDVSGGCLYGHGIVGPTLVLAVLVAVLIT